LADANVADKELATTGHFTLQADQTGVRREIVESLA
jgi:hypothetical protein